jgi:hypothetical protein
VAARLSPINSLGDPLGARVALLEMAGGVRKRVFPASFALGLSSFSFLSRVATFGGGVGEEGVSGWGELGEVTPLHHRLFLRRFLCVWRRRTLFHTSRFIARSLRDGRYTHVQDALAKKGLNRPLTTVQKKHRESMGRGRAQVRSAAFVCSVAVPITATGA